MFHMLKKCITLQILSIYIKYLISHFKDEDDVKHPTNIREPSPQPKNVNRAAVVRSQTRYISTKKLASTLAMPY
jgi:hypothetical protein